MRGCGVADKCGGPLRALSYLNKCVIRVSAATRLTGTIQASFQGFLKGLVVLSSLDQFQFTILHSLELVSHCFVRASQAS